MRKSHISVQNSIGYSPDSGMIILTSKEKPTTLCQLTDDTEELVQLYKAKELAMQMQSMIFLIYISVMECLNRLSSSLSSIASKNLAMPFPGELARKHIQIKSFLTQHGKQPLFQVIAQKKQQAEASYRRSQLIKGDELKEVNAYKCDQMFREMFPGCEEMRQQWNYYIRNVCQEEGLFLRFN